VIYFYKRLSFNYLGGKTGYPFVVALLQLCFSKQSRAFLRQAPVANKNNIVISAIYHSYPYHADAT
jgi:hypothetical protein